MKNKLKTKWFKNLIKRKYGPSATYREYNGKIYIFDAAFKDSEPHVFNSMDEAFKQLYNQHNIW